MNQDNKNTHIQQILKKKPENNQQNTKKNQSI